MKFIKHIFTQHKIPAVTILSLLALIVLVKAFAIGSPYGPGDTLDPACAPGDTNCFVRIFPDQTSNAGKFLKTDGSVVSWDTVAAGVTGSGTTNYVPKWSSSTVLGNSVIYDDGTNVGIGTATPSYKLHLYQNANASQRLLIENVNAGTSADNKFSMFNDLTQGVTMLNFSSAYAGNIQGTSIAKSSVQLHINTFTGVDNSGTLVLGGDNIYSLGSVWAAKLDSNGLGIRGIATIHNANPSGNALTVNSGNTYITNLLTNASATAALHVAGNTADSTAYALKIDDSASSTLFYVRNDGVISSLNGYSQNGARILSVPNGLTSVTIVGNGAGNDTLTGISNTLVGRLSGSSLSSGTNNTFVGTSSGIATTIGSNNSAYGVGSLSSNSSSSQITAYGYNSLRDGTGLDNSAAFGAYAGSVIDGIKNVLLGVETNSSVITDPDQAAASATYNNSIAIGYSSKIVDDNQLVVGSKAANINNAFFGRGVATNVGDLGSFGLSITGVAPGITDGSAAASILNINGAKGTGTGLGGDIVFNVATAGLSGSTQNSLVEAMRISQNGTLQIGTSGSAKGITLYDTASPTSPYCITVTSGVVVATPGACS